MATTYSSWITTTGDTKVRSELYTSTSTSSTEFSIYAKGVMNVVKGWYTEAKITGTLSATSYSSTSTTSSARRPGSEYSDSSTDNYAPVRSNTYTYKRKTSAYTVTISYKIKIAANSKTSTTSQTFTVPALDKYTITYKSGYADDTTTVTQTKYYGNNITLRNSWNSRLNYSLTGWNTAENGSGTSYALGATFSGNANTTLYAQWSNTTYSNLRIFSTSFVEGGEPCINPDLFLIRENITKIIFYNKEDYKSFYALSSEHLCVNHKKEDSSTITYTSDEGIPGAYIQYAIADEGKTLKIFSYCYNSSNSKWEYFNIIYDNFPFYIFTNLETIDLSAISSYSKDYLSSEETCMIPNNVSKILLKGLNCLNSDGISVLVPNNYLKKEWSTLLKLRYFGEDSERDEKLAWNSTQNPNGIFYISDYENTDWNYDINKELFLSTYNSTNKIYLIPFNDDTPLVLKINEDQDLFSSRCSSIKKFDFSFMSGYQIALQRGTLKGIGNYDDDLNLTKDFFYYVDESFLSFFDGIENKLNLNHQILIDPDVFQTAEKLYGTNATTYTDVFETVFWNNMDKIYFDLRNYAGTEQLEASSPVLDIFDIDCFVKLNNFTGEKEYDSEGIYNNTVKYGFSFNFFDFFSNSTGYSPTIKNFKLTYLDNSIDLSEQGTGHKLTYLTEKGLTNYQSKDNYKNPITISNIEEDITLNLIWDFYFQTSRYVIEIKETGEWVQKTTTSNGTTTIVPISLGSEANAVIASVTIEPEFYTIELAPGGKGIGLGTGGIEEPDKEKYPEGLVTCNMVAKFKGNDTGLMILGDEDLEIKKNQIEYTNDSLTSQPGLFKLMTKNIQIDKGVQPKNDKGVTVNGVTTFTRTAFKAQRSIIQLNEILDTDTYTSTDRDSLADDNFETAAKTSNSEKKNLLLAPDKIRLQSGNIYTRFHYFYPDKEISLDLKDVKVTGYATTSSGELYCSVPLPFIPYNVTLKRVYGSVVTRCGSQSSTGQYLTRGNSSTNYSDVSFDTQTTNFMTFYNANNTQKQLTQSMVTHEIKQNWLIIKWGDGTAYFFTGTSTLNSYCNNQPVAFNFPQLSIVFTPVTGSKQEDGFISY